MKKFLAIFALTVAFAISAQAAPQVNNAAPATKAAPAPADVTAAQKGAPVKPQGDEPKAIDDPAYTPPPTETIGAPHEWGYNYQPRTTELFEKMYDFNAYLNYIISGIVIIVLGLIAYIAVRFHHKRNPEPSKTTHNTLLEIIWTTIPIIVVIAIVIPSIRLLYYADRTEHADLTLKVVGYQWYWSYELPDQGVKEFESRLIPEEKLKTDYEKKHRLMEVDEPLILPVGKTVRVLVTADPNGVIHSWGVAGLAFKRDAMPGRTNEGWLKIEKPGIYYGECYQLCGVDHAFMPIKIIGVSEDEFNRWVISKGGKISADKNEVTIPNSTPGKNANDPKANNNAVDANGKPVETAPQGTVKGSK